MNQAPARDDDSPQLGSPRTRGEVSLLFLAPVYQRGLALGLRDAGYVVHVPPDLDGWAQNAEEPVLLVAPDSDAAFRLLVELRKRVPDALSVALLEQTHAAAWSRALHHCTGAVPLDAELEDVVDAVRAAQRGHAVLPTTVIRGFGAAADHVEQPAAFTAAELAWLRALAANKTVGSLARAAGVSEREMYRQLNAIYARLGARTRTEALLVAERRGLLREQRPPGADSTSRAGVVDVRTPSTLLPTRGGGRR